MIQVTWLAVVDMLEHARQCADALRQPEAMEPDNAVKRASLTAERTGLVKAVAMLACGGDNKRSENYTPTFYRLIEALDAGLDPADLAHEIASGKGVSA